LAECYDWPKLDWPKPQLAEDRLAEKLNWPTSRLAEITNGRKLKLAENEQRARYGPPDRFRPISSIFAFYFLCVMFHYSSIHFRIVENEKIALDCHEWLKNNKKNKVASKT
jgi:hypothetical protein